MLLDIEFEGFTMRAVRITIGVMRLWMRSIVFGLAQQFPHRTFLKFDVPDLAETRRDLNELFCNCKVAPMVAAHFSDHYKIFCGYVYQIAVQPPSTIRFAPVI